MTVPYSRIAATARANILMRVLFIRWDGSVWQLIKLELAVWAILYLALNRFFFYYYKNLTIAKDLYQFSLSLQACENPIMLPFLLGFFTIITIQRWWKVYELMEWPDSVASSLAVHLRPKTSKMSESEVQILRRTLAKHLQLSFILLLREISVPIRERFPSLNAIGRSKLLNEEEMRIIKMLSNKMPKRWCLYWIPFQWLFSSLKKAYFVKVRKDLTESERIREAHESSLFSSKHEYLHVVKELMAYRMRMGTLFDHDWMASPTLACTQTIIFAVYGFIAFALFSRQKFDQPHSYCYVFAAVFEMGIYLAWLKSTLIMINPFGSDKDDFEVVWLTDRHWRVIYRILDEPWMLFPETTYTRKNAQKKKAKTTICDAYSQEMLSSPHASRFGAKLSVLFNSRQSAGLDCDESLKFSDEIAEYCPLLSTEHRNSKGEKKPDDDVDKFDRYSDSEVASIRHIFNDYAIDSANIFENSSLRRRRMHGPSNGIDIP